MASGMDRTGKEKMKRGILLFAFNSSACDYYKMAVFTAKRVNHFLNLPVTLVTDVVSHEYTFDNVINVPPDKNNVRDGGVWINKGRYMAYDLSPYDDTIIIDVDYLINSNSLLKLFDLSTDFCCHEQTNFLLQPNSSQELLNSRSFNTLWATVVMFRKSQKAKTIFNAWKMIQDNYEHYSNIHGFVPNMFRNDYAVTLATRLIDGHLRCNESIIPWRLMHVGKTGKLYKNTTEEFNTSYTYINTVHRGARSRTEYIQIKDFDFHIMDKKNFQEIM